MKKNVYCHGNSWTLSNISHHQENKKNLSVNLSIFIYMFFLAFIVKCTYANFRSCLTCSQNLPKTKYIKSLLFDQVKFKPSYNFFFLN